MSSTQVAPKGGYLAEGVLSLALCSLNTPEVTLLMC